jgi:hypothetical protein
MRCPGCGADVDAEQDFCMECGEPIKGLVPKTGPPASVDAAPKGPADGAAGGLERVPEQAPQSGAQLGSSQGSTKSMPANVNVNANVKRRRRDDTPEPLRCPGCGAKTTARRCPGCGTPLRRDEDE